jgi:hypothetical protein
MPTLKNRNGCGKTRKNGKLTRREGKTLNNVVCGLYILDVKKVPK